MTKTLNLNKKALPITDDIGRIYDAAYAKKNRAEKYHEVAKGFSPWIKRLVDTYKAHGVFPITPALLGDFYKDPNDKVIATIIGSLCVNILKTDSIVAESKKLLSEIGEHPYENFFKKRQYVLLSLAENQENQIGNIGSMKYWQISRLVDSLWKTRNMYGGKSLEEIFKLRMRKESLSPYNAFTTMIDMTYVRNADYRINLALMALCDDDGISYRLWDIGASRKKLQPPMERWYDERVSMGKFLNILLPHCTKYMFSPTEVANIMGLSKPIDLWYAYHAYKLIYRKKGVGKFMRRYHSQVKNYSIGANNREQLRLMEPEITF